MNEEENYQLVSIEEMRELTKCKAYYLPEEELKFEEWSGNLRCNVHINWWKPNLLRDHLLLEECMSRDDIDWRFTTHAYDFRMIAYLRYLWYNPLVWVPISDDFKKKHIIDGRIAEERYVKRDYFAEPGTPIAYDFSDEMLDWFVRKMPKPDGSEWTDILEANYVIPDICLWHYLTTDDNALRISITQGGAFDLSLLKLFSTYVFVANMKRIAEFYGGTKAAEILQLFRKDWQRIITLKLFNINKLTPEQIEEFRACLFEGMDYYLEQWEKEAEEEKKDEKAKKDLPKIKTPEELKNVLRIPHEKKYGEVWEYVELRAKYDREFKTFATTHSLRELAYYLSDEFGWDVKENSLSRNKNRNL